METNSLAENLAVQRGELKRRTLRTKEKEKAGERFLITCYRNVTWYGNIRLTLCWSVYSTTAQRARNKFNDPQQATAALVLRAKRTRTHPYSFKSAPLAN